MCLRKGMKRFPPLRTRLFGKISKLSSTIQSQLDDIMKKELFPRRILLVGNPTTLTSVFLKAGSLHSRPIYRVDLSLVISKYIGETEKNLGKVFTKAKNKDWILFFDEVDALFGKRTAVKDASDRFANIEVSWLLQRMEAYEGPVILASNEKGRISDDVLEQLNIEVVVETGEDEDKDESKDEVREEDE